MLSKTTFLLLLLVSGLLAQTPTIVSRTPSRNALNVPTDAVITVVFDQEMDGTTINDSTFVVHGNFTSKLGGNYLTSGSTATFTPAAPFKVGEQVSVTLTTGVKSAAGDTLASSYTWTFTTEVLGGGGEFAAAVNYGAGDGPLSVTAADLDGDGDSDLAVANVVNDNVSVLLGNGDGTYAAAVNYGVGSYPWSVTAADLDGDGDCDLAVANAGSDNVSVLLNVDLTPPSAPSGLAINDSTDGTIALLWDQNSEADVLRYRVYRGTEAAPTTVLDSTAGATDTTIAIADLVNGTPYYFRVTAVDTALNESGYSAEVSARPNGPPLWSALDTLTFAEDDSLVLDLDSLLIDANDADSTLVISFSAGSDVSVTVDSSTHVACLKAVANYNGTDSVSFTATDPWGHTAIDTVVVLVTPVNDPPVVAHAVGITVLEGDTVAVTSDALQVLDVDNTNAELHFTLEAQPTNLTGEFRLSGVALADTAHFTQADIDSGLISFTHDGSETTLDSIGFWISDSAGATAHIAYFPITVVPMNDPPEPFALLVPADGDTAEVVNDSLLFVWESSVDIEGDTQVYHFHIYGPGYDTTIAGLADTALVLTGMPSLALDSLYTWFVDAFDGTDTTSCLAEYQFRMPSVLALDPLALIPDAFALHQNYPNPFNPTTTIKFDLPQVTDVVLVVYDILGREVVRLVDRRMESSYHQVIWDGRDIFGRYIPSGLYIARLVTPEYTKSIKMVLLK